MAEPTFEQTVKDLETAEVVFALRVLREEIRRRAVDGDVLASLAAHFFGGLGSMLAAPVLGTLDNLAGSEPSPPPNPALERARAYAQKTDAEKKAEALEAARKAFPSKGRR